MRRVFAIAWLTFHEGIRMRIVLVFLVVLVILVLRMPFALRGDETLAGRLQNFLAYSLGALSLLLSLVTVFFSCATLTNEIKQCSLHLVVTKPVSRFQILLGKWLGVNLLNLLIVALCGVAIYGFAYFIQSRPETFARDRLKLRDVLWTARVAANPVFPMEQLVREAAEYVDARIEMGETDPAMRRDEILKRLTVLRSEWLSIKPNTYRFFNFENLAPPESDDTVYQMKFQVRGLPIPPQETVFVGWTFFDAATGRQLGPLQVREERVDRPHEFLVNAKAVVSADGRALVRVDNLFPPEMRTAIIFEHDESLQLMYKVGTFETNLAKALLIVVFRLAWLSALGLFMGVFVSFPVACFTAAVFYGICLAFPFIFESIGGNLEYAPRGTDPLGMFGPYLRFFLVPFMQAAFPNFSEYDGIRFLVDGQYIPLTLLWRAFAHTFAYGVVLLLLPGWLIFRWREVAAVTV